MHDMRPSVSPVCDFLVYTSNIVCHHGDLLLRFKLKMQADCLISMIWLIFRKKLMYQPKFILWIHFHQVLSLPDSEWFMTKICSITLLTSLFLEGGGEIKAVTHVMSRLTRKYTLYSCLPRPKLENRLRPEYQVSTESSVLSFSGA